MATDLSHIAEVVSSKLKHLSPEISFSPEYDLHELSNQKCVIVPLSSVPMPLCRNSKFIETVSEIEIGFLYRAKKIDVQKLISEVKDIAAMFQHIKVGNARCIKISHDPLFDPEQLRERNQFTSVISLTFKEISND